MENEYINNVALANELAAKFYLSIDKGKIAKIYFRQAHNHYYKWGALAKVAYLEEKYPQFYEKWIEKKLSIVSESPTTSAAISSAMLALEYGSIIKSAQTLSSEVVLSKLLEKLMTIIIENAGAQRGFLILNNEGNLTIEIIASVNPQRISKVDSIKLDEATDLCVGMVTYVSRTMKSVILNDATLEGDYTMDRYIQKNSTKSVLCSPIINQGRLIGIIYLENNLTAGTFTADRIEILNILSSQAAISLENARIYEVLRQNEQKLRAIFDQTFQFIGLLSTDGIVLEANNAGLQSAGIEKDAVVGKPFWDTPWWTHSPEMQQRLREAVRKARRGKLVRFEATHPTPDGRLRYIDFSLKPITDSSGRVVQLIPEGRDITERKEAEEEIAWNLAINQALSSLYVPLMTAGISIKQITQMVLDKSRELTDSAHGYVGEIDLDTGDLIAHTNTKMIQTECEITKTELDKIRFPQKADGLYNGLWGHTLNTKESFYTNDPLSHAASVGTPEGHIAIERFLTVPVLLDGELVGQIALSNSSRPYTDRDLDAVTRVAEFLMLAIKYKRSEEKIFQLNQELEQRVVERTAQLEAANKELEAFAYTVSHDLRAPLRHISGFVEMLQEQSDAVLDDKSRHYIETILYSSERMGMLIDGLLSFSRLGRRELFWKQVDLNVLVREIMHEVESETKGRTINWKIGELPVVSADPTLMLTVMLNLISNAIKFTRPREVGEIEIGGQIHSTESIIYVRDNGVGFDMKYADKLFRVFERLHRTDEFEGTGIGLANIYRIIARHGGRTWAVGAINQGATFYFSLPQTRQKVI
jgi:PAS domain S-box-containing protein